MVAASKLPLGQWALLRCPGFLWRRNKRPDIQLPLSCVAEGITMHGESPKDRAKVLRFGTADTVKRSKNLLTWIGAVV